MICLLLLQANGVDDSVDLRLAVLCKFLFFSDVLLLQISNLILQVVALELVQRGDFTRARSCCGY